MVFVIRLVKHKLCFLNCIQSVHLPLKGLKTGQKRHSETWYKYGSFNLKEMNFLESLLQSFQDWRIWGWERKIKLRKLDFFQHLVPFPVADICHLQHNLCQKNKKKFKEHVQSFTYYAFYRIPARYLSSQKMMSCFMSERQKELTESSQFTELLDTLPVTAGSQSR